MPEPAGKNVLIGVTGGIAAYKVAELARMLVRGGVNVKVIMTSAGQQFVTPLTFRTITGNPVATSMWSDPASPLPHISLSEEADLLSLIHISEPTRLGMISYAVFCLKKKKKKNQEKNIQ